MILLGLAHGDDPVVYPSEEAAVVDPHEWQTEMAGDHAECLGVIRQPRRVAQRRDRVGEVGVVSNPGLTVRRTFGGLDRKCRDRPRLQDVQPPP